MTAPLWLRSMQKNADSATSPLAGGGIGDRAFFSIGAHLFNGCLNAVEYAGLVYGNGAVPLFQRGAGYILAVRDACIVNEHIQLAESGFCESDAFLPCRIIGHVQLEEGRVGASLSARARPSASFRSAITTLAPSLTKISAVQAPMPCAAPVMMATFAFQTLHAYNFLSEW